MSFLPTEGVPDDRLACQVVCYVDLQADHFTDPLLSPVDLEFKVTVVEGDLRERHRRTLTQHKGLVLPTPRLIVVVDLPSQSLCFRGREVVRHGRLAEWLVRRWVVQLTRLRVVDRQLSLHEAVVPLSHRTIVGAHVVVVEGEEEVKRVAIHLSRLLVAELLTDQAFVAVLLKLTHRLAEARCALRERVPDLLTVVADSAGELLPSDGLLASHDALEEAHISLEVLHSHQYRGIHRVFFRQLSDALERKREV